MGGMESIEEESTPLYSQNEAEELLSGESESSVTSVELPLLENVVPVPVVHGVVWSLRHNHLSPYILVPATRYCSSSHVVHAALSKHATESGVGVTPDRT